MEEKLLKPNKKITLIIGLCTILIVITTTIYHTCSLFFKEIICTGTVSAATEEDIIQYASIDNTNPAEIVIKPADNLDYNPIIYFSIEGEIKDYIMHINPVQLGVTQENIPIRLKVNLPQYMELLQNNKDKICGMIYIKYLNGFIDKNYEVEFTKSYILDIFNQDNNMQEPQNNDIEPTETQEIATDNDEYQEPELN